MPGHWKAHDCRLRAVSALPRVQPRTHPQMSVPPTLTPRPPNGNGKEGVGRPGNGKDQGGGGLREPTKEPVRCKAAPQSLPTEREWQGKEGRCRCCLAGAAWTAAHPHSSPTEREWQGGGEQAWQTISA